MTGFSKSVRDTITDRAYGSCERCGLAAPAYQIHHRRPRGMGGSSREDTNTAANALFTCVACHSEIEANRAAALMYGWLVRQGHDPADVPVMVRGVWVMLDDQGGIRGAAS